MPIAYKKEAIAAVYTTYNYNIDCVEYQIRQCWSIDHINFQLQVPKFPDNILGYSDRTYIYNTITMKYQIRLQRKMTKRKKNRKLSQILFVNLIFFSFFGRLHALSFITYVAHHHVLSHHKPTTLVLCQNKVLKKIVVVNVCHS